jgi:hypothetical protein
VHQINLQRSLIDRTIKAGLPKKPLEKIFQCAAEGRIDDDHLAPPQAQDFPDDGADVVHIHLLYDPARLDLLFESITQGVKFIGRFGDEQRQFRQKGQIVSSTHLLTSETYSRPGSWLARRKC